MAQIIIDAAALLLWQFEYQDKRICELLVDCGHKILIPEQVRLELDSNNPIISSAVSKSQVVSIKNQGRFLQLKHRMFKLSDTDISALLVAEETSSHETYLFTPDPQVRDAGKQMGIETLSIIQLYALLFDEQEMTYSEIETDLEMLKSGGTEIPDNYVALLRQYCTRPLS